MRGQSHEQSGRHWARRHGLALAAAAALLTLALAVPLTADQDDSLTPGQTSAGDQRVAGAHACPSPPAATGVQSVIDYVDVLHLQGRRYAPVVRPPAVPVVLGAAVGSTACRTADAGDASYLLQDLDASLLPAGTVLRQVEGFDPAFRVAADVPGGPVVYEASSPAAGSRTGAEVFPGVQQHVVALVGLSVQDGRELRRVTDPDTVHRFVDDLLLATVQLDRRDLSVPAAGFVGLVLDDGTTVSRVYHGAEGVLAPGLTLPPDARRTAAELLDR